MRLPENPLLVTLPTREEMLRRLVEADSFQDYADRFYPMLLTHAERQINSIEVMVLLVRTCVEHSDTAPAGRFMFMMGNMKGWIEALIDDPAAVREAEDCFTQLMNNAVERTWPSPSPS